MLAGSWVLMNHYNLLQAQGFLHNPMQVLLRGLLQFVPLRHTTLSFLLEGTVFTFLVVRRYTFV